MDSLLTTGGVEKHHHNNSNEANEVDFKGRISLQQHHHRPGMPHPHQQQQQQQQQSPNNSLIPFGKLGPSSGFWKMPRPMDGVHHFDFTRHHHQQLLELGTTSQRPTTLSLRPTTASESAMRQVENVLMPLRPTGATSNAAQFGPSGGGGNNGGDGGGLTDRTISDEEVQSSFRTSTTTSQGGSQFATTHNEGLESIFSFNYDQPRSTINALLPVSTSTTAAAAPNTELGFSSAASPQYNSTSRARASPSYGYNPSST